MVKTGSNPNLINIVESIFEKYVTKTSKHFGCKQFLTKIRNPSDNFDIFNFACLIKPYFVLQLYFRGVPIITFPWDPDKYIYNIRIRVIALNFCIAVYHVGTCVELFSAMNACFGSVLISPYTTTDYQGWNLPCTNNTSH